MQNNLYLETNLLSFTKNVRNNFDDIEKDANLLAVNRNYREIWIIDKGSYGLKEQL